MFFLRNHREVFGEQVADICVEKSDLNNICVEKIDVPDAIDEIPVLTALAVATKGIHTFAGVEELRFKECDRIDAILKTAAACGQKAVFDGNTLTVVSNGAVAKKPNFQTFGDHRIAMSQAVLCLGACDGGTLDRENFDVSFPNFLSAVGVKPLRFALVGSDISHSMSPKLMMYFASKAEVCCSYKLVELQESIGDEQLLATVSRYDGCNITMPFKRRISKLLHAATPTVNTVGKNIEPQSTDGFGVVEALRSRGVEYCRQPLWVIGAGGAAEAAVSELSKFCPNICVINRTAEHAAVLSEKYGLRQTIQNPIGVLVFVPRCEWEKTLKLPRSIHFVFCARYGDDYWRNRAKEIGAEFIDGTEMLFYQGVKSFSLWTGKTPRVSYKEWLDCLATLFAEN